MTLNLYIIAGALLAIISISATVNRVRKAQVHRIDRRRQPVRFCQASPQGDWSRCGAWQHSLGEYCKNCTNDGGRREAALVHPSPF